MHEDRENPREFQVEVQGRKSAHNNFETFN